jgi:hypothetical protein
MRYLVVVMLLVLSPLTSAFGQVSIQIELPSVSIGFNQPYYPELVEVPGYPVYYAPGSDSNFFFYDGMYWVYERDNWYASSWYNGPWSQVASFDVPFFILRVPVRYYRHPPAYFRGWHQDAPPQWGDHWGHDWEQRRSGWDQWDRRSAPAPAPLPVYQKQYSGDRYPPPQQQQVLHGEHYRHAPGDDAVKKVYQEQRQHAAQPAPQRAEPAREAPRPQQQPAREAPRAQEPAKEAPHMQQPAKEAPHMQQPAKEAPHMQQPAKEAPRAQQPAKEAPRTQPARAPEKDKGQPQGKPQGRDQEQDKDQGKDKDKEQGRGRDK